MNNPDTITGLSSATTYDVFVRAVCGPMDVSSSQGPITFTTVESCVSPSNFAPVTQTANSISFVWDANGNSSPTFEVEYGVAPYALGSGGITEQQFTAPFADVTGLASDTCYDFYVRIDCGMGDFSLFAGPYNACTQISCFPVGALQASNISFDSIDVDWTAGQAETEWELEYALAGVITTPFSGQGMLRNVMGTPMTSITGLVDDTVYDIYVRAVCDPAIPDLSSVQTITINTQCLPIAATTAMPYMEDFETFTASTVFERQNCWSATSSSTYDWNVTSNGTTPSINTGPDAANSGTNYMYIESGGANGDVTTLFSPIINICLLYTSPSPRDRG